MNDDSIIELSKIMNIVDYEPNTTIYFKNEKVEKFLIINSGSCKLINDEKDIIRELSQNDFFGLISLFTNSSKNYNLITNCKTQIIELNKNDLVKLTSKYPKIKGDLLQVVNKQIFNPEINSAINKIAQGVDSKTIEELKKDLSWKTLDEEEILFNQGDNGDSCYIVMSGRVEAIVNYGEDNEKILGELKKGDVIGDMALITGEKRSATIKAAKLSRLIYISKKSFDDVMYNNPKALMEVSKALINRLKYKNTNEKINKNIIVGIVSLLDNKGTQEFYDLFSTNLKLFGTVENLTELTSNLNNNEDSLDFEILLENMISNNDFLLLHSNDTSDVEWKKNIAKYSDQIIVIGKPNDLKKISENEKKIFNNYSNINLEKIWFILNHDKNVTTPSNTNQIIKLRKGIRTFHIKDNNESDIKRIVRFITKQTIGLTLGGGGAKGFAHFGIYKAMHELNIPIDIIGGTSAGSIVASQIALGHNFEEIINKNQNVNSLKMFKEYGIPYISLIKSNKIVKASKISAEGRNIEDLWIPFFAPATDLTNSKLIIFDKGPLWEAIRSSGALPGIVLPHFINGDIIVDGGLMNNLPVDIMRKKYGGKIICSSCSLDKSMKTSLDGIPNQLRLLITKFFNKSKFERKYKYVPTITDIIFKTSVVASTSQINSNIKMSDLFLELPTSKFGLTEFNDDAMMKMIEIGYQYSKPQLEKFKDTLII